MGQRIAKDVTSGDIPGRDFPAGGNNVQPRLNGIIAALKTAAPAVRVLSINTGAEQAQRAERDHRGVHRASAGQRPLRGGRRQHGVDRAAVTSKSLQGKVHAGGYDLLADTIKGVSSGALDFTIDSRRISRVCCRCFTFSCTDFPAPW